MQPVAQGRGGGSVCVAVCILSPGLDIPPPAAGIKTLKRSDYAFGFTVRNNIVKEILRKIKSIDPSHRGRHEAPFS